MEKKLNLAILESAMATKGLNQAKLAETLEVSPTIVSQWLKGAKMPRPDKLLKLGLLLQLPFNKLVIQTPDPSAPVIASHEASPDRQNEVCYAANRECSEKDWKYMRSIQAELLEKLARRINEKTIEILQASELPEIKKYQAVYRHLHESDQIVACSFDDWRRSTLRQRLVSIYRQGLLSDEQLRNLSSEIRKFLWTLNDE